MKLVIYAADCIGNAKNCLYPHRVVASNAAELAEAVAQDHVAARYTNNYRSRETFEESVLLEMDCDNDHSDNPADWITPESLAEDADLGDVQFATTPSRHNMLPKNGKAARPRFHFHAVIDSCTDPEKLSEMKRALYRKYPFFDKQALDAGRFLFGNAVSEDEVFWNDGFLTVDEILTETDYIESPAASEPARYGESETERAILEGSRNNTLSHFAGRVLKRFGITDSAHKAFLDRARRCTPPLPTSELDAIWRSAIKFYEKKVSQTPGYISPEEYGDDFSPGYLKPEDYSDLGEARVLAADCADDLKFTSATGFLTYGGTCWNESMEKSLGTVEAFLDKQLEDANATIAAAEDALINRGYPEGAVRGHGKELEKLVNQEDLGLLYELIGAMSYHKFVMKYRNYKNISNAMNTSKPMIAIDISEMDYDANLLNTPTGTYDLEKGMDGCAPHDPDDLITKITACGPGDTGTQIWLDALNLFFCGDQDLIDYVQGVVGLAAIGRVHAEFMIIAHGGGANGKSTFWNTIARLLGNYSGKISPEILTTSNKRNAKPEMAELKGKRLIIASELEEGTRLNTSMVKQLSSTDPIQAEKKYKDPFSFDPSHTVVLYTNHLPRVGALDDGTWRRLIVIPFNAKITGRSDIKNYSDYLYAEAGPAIMKWIIEGAQKAIALNYNLPKPEAVREAIAAYRRDNDWLGQFIEAHCEVDPSYSEKSGELYQAYRNACIMNGEYIRGTNDFYGSLELAGFGRRRTSTARLVMGLRLKEGQDFLE